MITVEVPRALVVRLDEDAVIELRERCATVREALTALARRSPGLVDRILDEQGRVRQHVNLFVDDDDIRQTGGLDSPLHPHSRIHLLASVSGG
jgi:sulfur-carrier protein